MSTIAQFRGTNRGLNFDGVDDYVSIPLTNNFTNISVLCQIYKHVDGKWNGIFGARLGKFLHFQFKDNGILEAYLYGVVVAITGSVPVPNNKWVSVGLTYDGNTFKLYLDGEVYAEKEFVSSSIISSSSADVRIGNCYDDDRFFNGEIKEVQVWNKALTQNEVRHYMNGCGGNEVGLVGYWLLNEGEGLVANDASKNLYFDGVDDYATVSTVSNAKSDLITWQVELTYYGFAGGTSKLLTIFPSDYFFIGMRSDHHPYFGLTGSTPNFTNSLEIGKTHNVTITYNNSTKAVRGFIDGVESLNTITTNSISASLLNSNPLYIGGRLALPDQSVNSTIHNVKLWNRILTDEEIVDGMFKSVKDTTDLVAHYKFNVGEGTTLRDSSGNGNIGTINGATWIKNNGTITGATWIEEPRNALSFDGVDDYCVLTNSCSTLMNNTQSWSYGCTVKSNYTGIAKRCVMGDYDGGSGYDSVVSAWIHQNQGKWWTCLRGTDVVGLDYIDSGIAVDLDWHKFIITINIVDGTATLNMYIDGELVKQAIGTNVVSSFFSNTPIRLGCLHVTNTLTEFFDGSIKDTHIWNKELTIDEVVHYQNNNIIGNETGLIAYYKFNEATGNILHDYTSNNNHGTINGAEWVNNNSSLLVNEIAEISGSNFTVSEEGTKNGVKSLYDHTAYTGLTLSIIDDGESFTKKAMKMEYNSNYVASACRTRFNVYPEYNDGGLKTISVFLKGEGSAIGKIPWTYTGTGWYIFDKPLTNKYQRYEITKKCDTSSGGALTISLYSGARIGDVIYIHSPQIEEKDHATSFTENIREPNSIIVEDFSECPDCLEFDGVGDYVDISSSLDMNGLTTVTISAYVYFTGEQLYVFSYGSSSSWHGYINYFIINSDGSLGIDIEDAVTLNHVTISSPTSAIPINEWSYASVTVSGDSIDMYVNGNNIKSYALPNGMYPLHSFNNFHIGRHYYSSSAIYYSKGKLKDVRIYNRALSNIDITKLYSGTNIDTGLIGYYKLDDGYGTRALDSSPNENHGTINGTEWQYSYEGESLINGYLKTKDELIEDIEF